MTSNSLSTKTDTIIRKRKSLLLHSLRSYWWLAVICSVVYGFAGPVYMLMHLDMISRVQRYTPAQMETEELFLQSQLGSLRQVLQAEGFMPLYLAAVALAAVIGCVMFFYLQQKKQVNFYHSQPVTRTRLFVNQYITGLLVNLVPMLLMLALMLGIIAAYGLGGALEAGPVLRHVAYMLLFALASYSIAVLSGQLAGTMMTQIAVNTVLHFAVPVAGWILNMLCNLFYATFNGGSALIETSLMFSPLCAMFNYLSEASAVRGTASMAIQPLDTATLLVNLAFAIGFTLLAWVLYQKRPSEATGKALVYAASEPILKGYLMFVVGIVVGLIFMAVGNKLFFYFGVVSFAILTHMTCEVIIQHDFRAMTKRLPQCAVLLVLVLAIVGIFRFDVLQHDAYLPEPDTVARVSLTVPQAENTSSSYENQYSSDPAVKQAVYDLLEPIVTGQQYRGSEFAGYPSPYDNGNVDTTSITVQYELASGKTASRIYRAIPAEAIEEAYANLYNQQAYREAIYREMLQAAPETVYSMYVSDTMIYEQARETTRMVETVSVSATREIAVTTEAVPQAATLYNKELQGYQVMAAILAAYQDDVRNRQFDTITKPRINELEIQLPRPGVEGRYNYVRMPIYEDDTRTMAVLQHYGLDIVDADHNYSEALIFRCAPASEAELRNMVNTAYNKLEDQYYNERTGYADQLTPEICIEALQDTAELTGHIIGVEAVSQFINDTKLVNGSGLFADYDDSHFVLLRYNHSGSYDWNNQLFYANTVPAQYQ